MTQRSHGFRLRLNALFHKRRMDRDMAEELAFHQQMMREKMMREGATPEEANAMTRREFGNEARWHERLSELWQFRSLEQLRRDTVFSFRLLRKSPVFTSVAVLTLALGIGANMSIFSMIDALLLRPLPVPHSEQLAVISMSDGGPEPNYSLASPFFRSMERRHDVFSQVFAFSRYPFNVRMRGGIEAMPGQMVSGEYFSGLETRPVLGRALTPKDDVPGAPVESLVLSYDTWQRRFGGSQAVLGQTLEVSKVMFTIVGVMPKGFYGADPTDRPAFFIPLATEPVLNPENSMTKAGYHGWWLSVMGRMRPEVSLGQADAALKTATMPILRESVPDAGWVAEEEKSHSRFAAEDGARGFTYMRLMFAKPLYAVFAMCGGILLLACLNLTSLLLARGASRERELATRLALGAARARLVQQMLIEALLLGAAGTAIGLAVAPLVSHSLAMLLLSGGNAIATPHLDTSLDLRVFGFAASLVAVLTLLIGLLPAVMATGGSVSDHLKEGKHASRSYTRRALLPRLLMGTEVGLALTLLIGAGLLTASLTRLYRSGIGYDPRGLELLSFMMETEHLHGDALAQRYQEIGAGLARQPGVRSVSFILISPFMGMSWDQGFTPQGEKAEKDVWMNVVAPGYFSTSGIAMLAGHDFSAADTASSSLKIVVNQAAAKLLFPNRNPIGQQITRKDVRSDKKLSYEVIAVVGDAKYSDIHKAAPATAYLTIAQNIDPFSSYNAVVRMDAHAPAGSLLAAARDVTRRVAPNVPAPTMTSLYQTIDNALATERVMVLLALYFAAVALLVTGIGLYGTLAYATARRTSEIGIRIALGAQRERVVALIFRENAMLALTGTAAGLVLALIAARALDHLKFLYATEAHDPLVLGLAVLALAAVASAASLVPALRASRIDPIRAIRCD